MTNLISPFGPGLLDNSLSVYLIISPNLNNTFAQNDPKYCIESEMDSVSFSQKNPGTRRIKIELTRDLYIVEGLCFIVSFFLSQSGLVWEDVSSFTTLLLPDLYVMSSVAFTVLYNVDRMPFPSVCG